MALQPAEPHQPGPLASFTDQFSVLIPRPGKPGKWPWVMSALSACDCQGMGGCGREWA